MRHGLFRVITGVWVGVIVGQLNGLAQKPTQQPKNVSVDTYYPLQVGNTWRYVNGVGSETVTRVVRMEKVGNEEGFRLETTAGNQVVASEVLAVRPDGIYRLAANDVPIDPPVPVLKAPIAAGNKWQFSARVKDRSIQGDLTIAAVEEQTATRAGQYACLKVSGDTLQLGKQKLAATFWYAPNVGLVKASVKIGEQETSLELAEFVRAVVDQPKPKPKK